MTAFDQLHPALKHHIVNSLGWRELRPFQEQVIPPVVAGRHVLVLAPTAGGKTEAAVFPLMSRMLAEGWPALSILYLCPIRALLNNLHARLERYCGLVGRNAGLWHGDVSPAARKAMLRTPPDLLLTTPESLEVMLVSRAVDHGALLGRVRAVVIDEIHAFAGDDRGWHLLSVLARVGRIAGRELQRVGLSATVGNPRDLASWLTAGAPAQVSVVLPETGPAAKAEVTLDFVGSLENAATVIARLHRGEKRLAFVDSRSRAEQLAAGLRQRDVATFVSHSSLSPDERRQAEQAFAARDNCVIVATSALELGIDVGDLDRVVQIDAPATVSSFLQRMGRTGRRTHTERNCLLLATSDEALAQAAGLIGLWREGYVESVVPPPLPYHILAQQLMALVLEEAGIGRHGWLGWLGNVPALARLEAGQVERVVQWMLDEDILWDEQGLLGLGRKGERRFGKRNFLELFSVFTAQPLFAVRAGRQELGYVDEATFLSRSAGSRVLLLGGRAWQVNHVDWPRRIAYVEPTEAPGRSRWRGSERHLGYSLCQAIRQVLAADDTPTWWSRRAATAMTGLRKEFAWLHADASTLLSGPDGSVAWWTFAGAHANASMAAALGRWMRAAVGYNNLAVLPEEKADPYEFQQAIEALRSLPPAEFLPEITDEAIDGLKFSACLPRGLAGHVLATRLADSQGVTWCLQERIRTAVNEG